MGNLEPTYEGWGISLTAQVRERALGTGRPGLGASQPALSCVSSRKSHCSSAAGPSLTERTTRGLTMGIK